MAKKNICLFTAHSPISGGGGTILRSLVENLFDVSVKWYYIGNKPAVGYEETYLGPALMGGEMISDILHTRKMLNGGTLTLIDDVVNKLFNVPCDEYWIVSHNEGLRIASDLANKQQERPVHVTIHDDWAGALCARSVRYRFLANAAQKLTVKVLQAVSSFDVVSKGMQDYYNQLSGRSGDICHRYLPVNAINVLPFNSTNEVIIGHIGSLYKKNNLVAFIKLVRDFFQPRGKSPIVKMWGCHLTINDIPVSLRGYIRFYPTAAEDEVIPLLAACDFVYAMYPMNKALNVFAKTSLPTKLTSYLQAGRPVFGHCPIGSSLTEYLNTTGLGATWNSNDNTSGYAALEKIAGVYITQQLLLNAREQYFGEQNLKTMDKIFSC